MAKSIKLDDVGALDKAPLPQIAQAPPNRSKKASVIASTRLLKGKPSMAEALIIDGHLECTSAHHEKHLIVGKHGLVKADIHAGTVVVFGQLVGDIYSEDKVSLARGSDVKGNIFCANVIMETGARFTGRIDTSR